MIINGDCLEEMRKMESNSISCIVTDPPYGLSFMGKGWDYAVPGTEYWKECLRITKPGGFLLAMGGTRTFHRLAQAIEESGYEIRDTIMWIYGSGFPKSHNHFGIDGYGTALKAAYEPIIMAMKKCDGTFKQNAQKWEQAGINIDECRIGLNEGTKRSHQPGYPKKENGKEDRSEHWASVGHSVLKINKGRWPANVIFDEEAAKMLDEQSGISKSPKGKCSATKVDSILKEAKGLHSSGRNIEWNGFADSGGASRFFYCAKASSSERGEVNKHPTVKPLKLMEYLIKLVMPPKDGILLDPFAGSGSTILAAHRLGFNAIGIEKEPEYCEIARERLKNIKVEEKIPDLFEKVS